MRRLAKVPLVPAEKKSGYERADYILAVTCFLANFFLLITSWQTIGVQADESVYIYGALRLLDGERIYRDFWVFNPPGIFLWIAAITTVFGKSLFAIRLVLFSAASAATAVLYLLSRKFTGKALSLVPSLLFIFVGVNLWPVSGHQWYSTLFVLFSIFFVARYLENRSRALSLCFGGFLAAVVFLFQQPKGGFLLASVFGLLLVEPWLVQSRSGERKDALRAALLFWAGAGTLFLAAATFFLVNGTLGEAFDAVIMFPIRMMSNSGGEHAGFLDFYGFLTKDLLSNMVRRSAFLSDGTWSISIVVFLINYAAPLSIPLSIAFWAVRRHRSLEHDAIGLLCALGAAAAFTAPLIRPDFHHLLSVIAPAYVTLAYVLHSFWNNSIKEKKRRVLQALAACSILLLLAGSLRIAAANIVYSSRLTILPLRSPLGFVPVLPKSGSQAAFSSPLVHVLDFLEVRTDPREKVFVMSFSPFLYYLSDRQSPSRSIDIPSSPCTGSDFHALKFGEASVNRQRLVTVVEDLEADKTRWIVVDPAASCQITDKRLAAAAADSDPLIDYILRHYRIEAEYSSFIIMSRSD